MTKAKIGTLDALVDQYRQDPDFLAEEAALALMEDVVKTMQDRGITSSDLAKQMGVSTARVSRLLNAPPNLTLRSIAALGLALGARMEVRMVAEGAGARRKASSRARIAAKAAGPPPSPSDRDRLPHTQARLHPYAGARWSPCPTPRTSIIG